MKLLILSSILAILLSSLNISAQNQNTTSETNFSDSSIDTTNIKVKTETLGTKDKIIQKFDTIPADLKTTKLAIIVDDIWVEKDSTIKLTNYLIRYNEKTRKRHAEINEIISNYPYDFETIQLKDYLKNPTRFKYNLRISKWIEYSYDNKHYKIFWYLYISTYENPNTHFRHKKWSTQFGINPVYRIFVSYFQKIERKKKK